MKLCGSVPRRVSPNWSSYMKVVSSIFLIMTALVVAPAQAQDTITVPFSDPSRPGLLKVTLLNGAIRVRGYSGKDVIIEGSSGGRRAMLPFSTPDGLRRI